MSRKFKWDMWDFDLDGSAYVIAKDECPNKKDVPAYIVHEDGLHPDVLNPELGECLCPEIVQEGGVNFRCALTGGIMRASQEVGMLSILGHTISHTKDGSRFGSSVSVIGIEARR